jgi:hypothetical protein
MSQGVIADPVVTRSGTAKIATPAPLKSLGVIANPVCVQFSGPITAQPDPI